jgi:hypothetical protein
VGYNLQEDPIAARRRRSTRQTRNRRGAGETSPLPEPCRALILRGLAALPQYRL